MQQYIACLVVVWKIRYGRGCLHFRIESAAFFLHASWPFLREGDGVQTQQYFAFLSGGRKRAMQVRCALSLLRWLLSRKVLGMVYSTRVAKRQKMQISQITNRPIVFFCLYALRLFTIRGISVARSWSPASRTLLLPTLFFTLGDGRSHELREGGKRSYMQYSRHRPSVSKRGFRTI